MLLKEGILHGFWKDEKPSGRLCQFIVLLNAWETGAKTSLGFFRRGKWPIGAHSPNPIASGKLVVASATCVSIFMLALSSLKGFNPCKFLAGIRSGNGVARAGGSSGN